MMMWCCVVLATVEIQSHGGVYALTYVFCYFVTISWFVTVRQSTVFILLPKVGLLRSLKAVCGFRKQE
jgi:hypothetical protein